jgi:hypothetical protein
MASLGRVSTSATDQHGRTRVGAEPRSGPARGDDSAMKRDGMCGEVPLTGEFGASTRSENRHLNQRIGYLLVAVAWPWQPQPGTHPVAAPLVRCRGLVWPAIQVAGPWASIELAEVGDGDWCGPVVRSGLVDPDPHGGEQPSGLGSRRAGVDDDPAAPEATGVVDDPLLEQAPGDRLRIPAEGVGANDGRRPPTVLGARRDLVPVTLPHDEPPWVRGVGLRRAPSGAVTVLFASHPKDLRRYLRQSTNST